MAASQPNPEVIQYLPDLEAVRLNIGVTYANDMINVSGLVENVGIADASGPFIIAIAVNQYTGGATKSFVQNFEVPAGVTLYGTHYVGALPGPFISRPPRGGGIITPLPTSYQTPNMEVPLHFYDVDGTTYTAEMLVDPYYQVDDPNRTNNAYSWPGSFWFLSLAVKEKKETFIIERAAPSR